MGIYDREYYRREGPSFLEAVTNHGKVCKTLILINVVVFVIQMLTRRLEVPAGIPEEFARMMGVAGVSPFTEALVLDVPDVLHGQVWRLLTYAFLHSETNVYHILFNMLFLWWFGSDIEDIYGPREFLAIYLSAAVAGGLAFTLTYVVGLHHASCLGASGAVTGVLVMCAFHYPTRTIWVFMLLPVPIWLFVLFQVAQDTFGLLGGGGGGVAFPVHLGGAAFGALYYLWGGRLLNFVPDVRSWLKQRNRPKLRVYREDAESARPVPVASASVDDVDEQLEAKLDAVLVKVQQSGKASLTDSENAILKRASEVYKRRRS